MVVGMGWALGRPVGPSWLQSTTSVEMSMDYAWGEAMHIGEAGIRLSIMAVVRFSMLVGSESGSPGPQGGYFWVDGPLGRDPRPTWR